MASIYRTQFPALRIVALTVICCWCASSGAAQATTTELSVKPVAVKVFEIGSVSNREFSRRWRLENWGSFDFINQLYIINYGSNKEIAFRERVMTNSISFRRFDRPRITLVRGGPDRGGSRTVVWRVPSGADNPEP